MTTATAPLLSSLPTSLAAFAPGKGARVAGRILTGIPAVFLAWDAAMKIVLHPMVVESAPKVGLPVETMQPIGFVLALCTLLYIVPRTAIVGAVLLTGYLGGAILVHLRMSDPLFTHTLFPVYVGALVWAGVLLRDPRARLLIARR